LRQIDLNGTETFTEPVSVEVTTSVALGIAGEYRLEQNWPNPFNPSTSIGYTVGVVSRQSFVVSSQWSVAGWVRLAVYDMLGREVAVLVDEQKQPGEYRVTWDASGMPSGVYFYRLTSGQFSDVKRMALVR